MNRIIALWGVPRSTSTAFLWMMHARGDFKCLHEPFGQAWMQGEKPLWPLYQEGDKTTKGLSLESTLNMLKKLALKQPVFIKDFPFYVDHFWGEEFFELFDHSFLIRDPEKTITSYYKRHPNLHEKDVGFFEQRLLFDEIRKSTGKVPPVIDADDVLSNPEQLIKLWCKVINISFIKNSLHWKPERESKPEYWGKVEDGYHENLFRSYGIKRQDRSNMPKVSELPGRLQEIYHKVLPHYHYLYQYRLKI